MKYYLGLGSNLGNRRDHLEKAITQINELLRPDSIRVSTVYETPALLDNLQRGEWNNPYLNLALELECNIAPTDILKICQNIEKNFGRKSEVRWAPREIDIDILCYNGEHINDDSLRVPHPELERRAFVLDPLKDLNPNLKLKSGLTALSQARNHPQHSPLWMAIVNLTPDSFSDGKVGTSLNEQILRSEITQLIDQNVNIIDIGGESTRPGATPVSVEEELDRVQEFLEFLKVQLNGKWVRPRVSIDTRHYNTAVQAVEMGAQIINDVSGLSDERMIPLISQSGCDYVLMHSLSVPANPMQIIPTGLDLFDELRRWFDAKISTLIKGGVHLDQIILDPGIGFGKSSLQSQELMKHISFLYGFGCRVLIGHSRKSFLSTFIKAAPNERDIDSIGVSLAMIQSGVDILRVHNPQLHMRAFKGWNHVRI